MEFNVFYKLFLFHRQRFYQFLHQNYAHPRINPFDVVCTCHTHGRRGTCDDDVAEGRRQVEADPAGKQQVDHSGDIPGLVTGVH